MNKFILYIIINLCWIMPAYCWSWGDLWTNPDIAAQAMMDKHDFKHAYAKFKRLDWKATAAYRAQNFQESAALFAQLHTVDGFYNLGNALALQMQYQKAIDAYQQALSLDPKNVDAAYNLEIVKKLLKQQQEKEQDSSKKSDESQPSKDQKKSSESKSKGKTKPRKEQEKSRKEQHEQQEDARSKQEQDQAKDQWLSLIPDDPGAFLREKFLRDYLRKHPSS